MRTVNEWFKQFNDGPEAQRWCPCSRRELSKVQVDAIRHCVDVWAAAAPEIAVPALLLKLATQIEYENDKL